MAKPTQAQIAWAFSAAKNYLARNNHDIAHSKTPYICFAIYKGRNNIACPTLPSAATVAMRIVQKRLEGCSTVWDWLEKKHGIIVNDVHQIQEYRHAWLDMLIDEFQKPVAKKSK